MYTSRTNSFPMMKKELELHLNESTSRKKSKKESTNHFVIPCPILSLGNSTLSTNTPRCRNLPKPSIACFSATSREVVVLFERNLEGARITVSAVTKSTIEQLTAVSFFRFMMSLY